ncbi:MAG: hypothetical protein HYX59_12645 [Elusimicrobia bacterium]|nr:hypothetical protein [Elusimicrobiota bacterium]
MGKFFALVIAVFTVVWLAPMCANLPSDLSTLSAPVAPPVPAAPVVSTVTAPAPLPTPKAEPKLEPAAAAVPLSPVTIATYRSRSMFPVEGESYVVSVLRKNHSEVRAEGVRLTVAARVKGEVMERAESGPGQSLDAGSSSYFGLPITTEVFNYLLDGPEDKRSGLEWMLTYRLASDPPGETRCFGLRALPRRREPSGLSWVPLGQTRKCEPPAP